ncbi:MAG: B12-binding domain-containing radical SAM protein [Candidatus Helarchaeota archaeon]
MHPFKGKKVVLTASDVEMSDFKDNPFIAFSAGFSHRIPIWSWKRLFFPPTSVEEDHSAVLAPYGLRKIEAALLESGFLPEEVITTTSEHLNKVIGPDTRVLAISSMDPLGLAYVSYTYSKIGFEGMSSTQYYFLKIFQKKCLKKYHPKIIVGGAGAWQIGPKARKQLGIDCVIVGEGDVIAPKIIRQAVEGEPIPPVIHVRKSPDVDEIPIIRNCAIHGGVEISRGCGRNCQFCTPTMRKKRDFPIDRIKKEVEVNVRQGTGLITLATEDLFLYKCKRDGKFNPNSLAVYNLIKEITSVPGVQGVQPAHISLAPVVVDPEMVAEVSHLMQDYTRFHYNGKGIIAAETGIETASPRLIKKYMRGKPLPFTPDEWPEIVLQGFGILNDNNWNLCATLITGLPGEIDADVIKSIELVDELFNYRVFLVPLLFANLHECILRNERRPNFDGLSDLQMEFFMRCWERNWVLMKKEWLNNIGLELLTRFITSILYLFKYRWGNSNLDKFRRRLISDIALLKDTPSKLRFPKLTNLLKKQNQ